MMAANNINDQFWHDKWASDQIGFHESAPHPMLCTHWPSLDLARGSSVFVPLCGKSNDMIWLAGQGHGVVGVELSSIAVDAFFSEQQLAPAVSTVTTNAGVLRVSRAGPYTLYCGDVFALDRDCVADCVAVYDRAALIALPPPARMRYAAHLAATLPETAVQLLITVAYDQNAVRPPPFIVDDDEVDSLYGPHAEVARRDHVPADVKGHPGTETVFLIRHHQAHARKR